ncbi:bursicon-like [Biomphalaria glabrata]|uniref:Bursicon-like n=1 Tax=Biomphalaria glabrata TaxID=6526 RepID=A0A9U8EJC1_BIOGL|nr:bursicon-like [Biomphalaria glabrata]
MTLTDTILMLAVLVAATSAMLYSRYMPGWTSSTRSAYTSSSPSISLIRLRQGLYNLQAKSRLDARSSVFSRDRCTVQGLILRLDPPLRADDNCETAYIQTSGCRGSCPSYSQVEQRNLTNIFYSCSCCQPIRFTPAVAVLPCRNGQHIRVPFKKVQACACRPCDVNEAPLEIAKLRDLLTKAAVDTPLPIG